MAGVTLKGVSKSFGENTVVQDVDITIADGEFVAVLGPSGCGKSTTLRMIAGLDPVTHGQIFIGNEDATRLEPGQRDVAMVFQSYALYPHMTVRENLEYGLKRKKVERQVRETRVIETTEMLRLDGLLERKPSQLSGGQRQRVALGRALIRHPSVLLMDEPLSNLDAKLRVHMRAEIMRLHASLGTTVIYVTHDQTEAMTMGQRIVVMDHGVVQQVGTPAELYSEPQSLFVATFLGSPEMNTFPGRLDAKSNRLQFHPTLPDAWVDFQTEATQGPVHMDVVVGIRPEHLRATPVADAAQRSNQVAPLGFSTVLFTENIGAQSFAYCELGEMTVSASLDHSRPVSRGDEVELQFDPRHLHMFNAETGRRVSGQVDVRQDA